MELRTTVASETCNSEERKGAAASRQLETTSLISLSLFSLSRSIDVSSVSGGRRNALVSSPEPSTLLRGF